MPIDQHGRLVADPFAHRLTKDGRVLISRGGAQVAVVAGEKAVRLRGQLAVASGEAAVQQLLARHTGNYRRGNERR